MILAPVLSLLSAAMMRRGALLPPPPLDLSVNDVVEDDYVDDVYL